MTRESLIEVSDNDSKNKTGASEFTKGAQDMFAVDSMGSLGDLLESYDHSTSFNRIVRHRKTERAFDTFPSMSDRTLDDNNGDISPRSSDVPDYDSSDIDPERDFKTMTQIKREESARDEQEAEDWRREAIKKVAVALTLRETELAHQRHERSSPVDDEDVLGEIVETAPRGDKILMSELDSMPLQEHPWPSEPSTSDTYGDDFDDELDDEEPVVDESATGDFPIFIQQSATSELLHTLPKAQANKVPKIPGADSNDLCMDWLRADLIFSLERDSAANGWYGTAARTRGFSSEDLWAAFDADVNITTRREESLWHNIEFDPLLRSCGFGSSLMQQDISQDDISRVWRSLGSIGNTIIVAANHLTGGGTFMTPCPAPSQPYITGAALMATIPTPRPSSTAGPPPSSLIQVITVPSAPMPPASESSFHLKIKDTAETTSAQVDRIACQKLAQGNKSSVECIARGQANKRSNRQGVSAPQMFVSPYNTEESITHLARQLACQCVSRPKFAPVRLLFPGKWVTLPSTLHERDLSPGGTTSTTMHNATVALDGTKVRRPRGRGAPTNGSKDRAMWSPRNLQEPSPCLAPAVVPGCKRSSPRAMEKAPVRRTPTKPRISRRISWWEQALHNTGSNRECAYARHAPMSNIHSAGQPPRD
jgi:hypothetical protein